MGHVVEHEGDDKGAVKVGDGQSLVPVKVYQDVYHQVTGRTEQIKQRYSKNLLIEFPEIEQLHFKVMQLCDVHHVVARNEVVSIFHDQERKEQFTSFERFRAYNANATSPTLSVVLKYNFSIIPAGLDKPQEYVVSIRLISRPAMQKQLEKEMPPFASQVGIIGYGSSDTAEITIDYVDYIIARGFLEACDEWIRGCKVNVDQPFVTFLQRWSYLIPELASLVVASLVIWFALQAIPGVFSAQSSAETWARYAVIFGGGFYLLVGLVNIVAQRIEVVIDRFSVLSYLKLNKGDEKLIAEFESRRDRLVVKFIIQCLLSVVLGYISSKLANLV